MVASISRDWRGEEWIAEIGFQIFNVVEVFAKNPYTIGVEWSGVERKR